MNFRTLPIFLLFLVASGVHGNELTVDYDGQLPENAVLEGLPITYSFRNIFVNDGEFDDSPNIGTGIQISVDGEVVTPASGIFVSNDDDDDGAVECNEDPAFPNAWKCDDLGPTQGGQEYSFTWTPPAIGSYVVDFLGFCQEQPVPDPPRLCAVNGNEGGSGTVAYVTTVVDVDTDNDGIADTDDPDDDNDGIADELDTQPLVPNNVCTGGDADNATLGQAIVDELTCAARVSIDVEGTTEVMDFPAHLRLIAPFIGIRNGFNVLEGGRLSVFSANPCPGCGGYQIGDTGPAGGIVFHVTDGGNHGLEAAPADQGSAPWGCFGTLTGADGITIGTGAQNTATILEACGEAGIAARLAFEYSLNGFDDWFLPSLDELLQLNLHQATVGGFILSDYWSSSEDSHNTAWYVLIPNGFVFFEHKGVSKRVRAIRSF